MQKSLRPTLVFVIFVKALIGIVSVLMTIITLNLAQIYLNLLVFLNHSSIDISGWSLAFLALANSTMRVKIFLG